MKLFLSHLPLLGAAFLAAVLLPTMANAQTLADCAWMYGIDDQNNIIEYNPEFKIARAVLNTGLTVNNRSATQGPANAFAFDSVRRRMFFLYDLSAANGGNLTDTGLYFWNQGSPGVVKIAEFRELFLTPGAQNPSNAVFANDNYYFIKWTNNVLVTCPINATPDVAQCNEKNIILPSGFPIGALQFGDTVIDKAGTTMYGSTGAGWFFNVTNLATSPALQVIKSAAANPRNPGVQLAFDGLYDTLYATEYTNGKWYTLNTTTGNLNEIPGFLTPNSAPNFFGARDLGGSSCIPSTPPTGSPTALPSSSPSASPSSSPSSSPSASPSSSPSSSPSATPSASPTGSPTALPSASPSASPSSSPSSSPSASPSSSPSSSPSATPSGSPSSSPTEQPTLHPTQQPSVSPSASPSSSPSILPSALPSAIPSASPSISPLSPSETGTPSFTSSTASPSGNPSPSPSTPPGHSSAVGDPHLIGASGVAYEFNGEPGGIYSLYSAPQFQLAMQLAGDGPGTHFMTEIGLLFKGEKFFFGEPAFTENFCTELADRLTRVGGSLLEWSSYQVKLAMCPGQTITLTQMHTTDPRLMRADGSPYNYYDVETIFTGCHDAYDGALGQTYKCKYAIDGPEVFAWSHGQEETFRLPSVFTPSSSYSPDTPCDTKPTDTGLRSRTLFGASAGLERRGLDLQTVHTTSLKMGKSKRYRSFSGQVLDGGSPSRIPI